MPQPQYPQNPVEFVRQAVEEAKRRGAPVGMVDPAIKLVERGAWVQARETIDMAMRRAPDACSNLRTKLSWAHQWAQGRLPGTMQANLDNHNYGPDDVRDAWLEIISGGKYEPPRSESETPVEEVVVKVDRPAKAEAAPPKDGEPVPPDTYVPRYKTLDPTIQHPDPDHGTSRKPSKGVEVTEGDNYADIQEAIDKGIL